MNEESPNHSFQPMPLPQLCVVRAVAEGVKTYAESRDLDSRLRSFWLRPPLMRLNLRFAQVAYAESRARDSRLRSFSVR
jgi:hypothetical protein